MRKYIDALQHGLDYYETKEGTADKQFEIQLVMKKLKRYRKSLAKEVQQRNLIKKKELQEVLETVSPKMLGEMVTNDALHQRYLF